MINLLVSRAAALIGRRCSDPVILKDQTRSLVLRCRTDGPPGSVIVKYMRDDTARGFTEWASLAFLTGVGVPEAPRFSGGDREHQFIILEDLGGSSTIEDVLRQGDAAAAESALQALAVSMARLQAATFGREAAFDAVRSALPIGEDGRGVEAVRWQKSWDAGWFQALDLRTPPGFTQCIHEIADIYAAPGPFLCFSHGDPAPSNNHVAGGRVRLLDFEYGAFRHALYDLSAWNVLCPMPPGVVQTMSRCFRDELGKTCPVILDDEQYAHAWAALCAYRALAILTWIKPSVIMENRPWVDEHWTCRHAVFAAVRRMQEAASGAQAFAPVAEAAGRLSEALMGRWPEFQTVRDVTPSWHAFS